MDVYGDSYGQLSANELAANSQRQQALQSAMSNMTAASNAAANRRYQDKSLDLQSQVVKRQMQAPTATEERQLALKTRVADSLAPTGNVDAIRSLNLPPELSGPYEQLATQANAEQKAHFDHVSQVADTINRRNMLDAYVTRMEGTDKTKGELADDPYKTGIYGFRSESPEHKEWGEQTAQAKRELALLHSTVPRALEEHYRDKLGVIAPIGEDGSYVPTVNPPPKISPLPQAKRSQAQAQDDEQAAATGGAGTGGRATGVPYRWGEDQPEDYRQAAYGEASRSSSVPWRDNPDFEALPASGGREYRMTPSSYSEYAPMSRAQRLELSQELRPNRELSNTLPNGDTIQRGLLKLRALRAATSGGGAGGAAMKTAKVRVQLPDGTVGSVPAANLPELLKRYPRAQVLN